MGAFLFSLIAGAAAGALTARQIARREVDAMRRLLDERMAPPEPVATVPVPQPGAAPEPEISAEITPELLMVLSAAVATFCGAKAKIKRARVAGPNFVSSAWAQQGRAFVQASHNLPHR
jgi:methylmalonyl-CoA carboxyltransferase 12S subunit